MKEERVENGSRICSIKAGKENIGGVEGQRRIGSWWAGTNYGREKVPDPTMYPTRASLFEEALFGNVLFHSAY